MNKTLKWPYLSLLLSGWLIAGYLLYRQLFLIRQASSASIDICQALMLGSCDAILSNEASLIGLPWAAWGVLYLSALLALYCLALFLESSFGRRAMLASYALAIPGLGMSLYLLSAILFGNSPFCGLCLVFHLLHLLGLYSLFRLYPLSIQEFLKGLQYGLAYLFLGKSPHPKTDKLSLISFLMLSFMLLALYQRLHFEIKVLQFYAAQMALAENTEDNFLAAPTLEIPIGPLDAQLGSAEAPVELVVFSDFECPYCAEFALICQEWQKKYSDQIRFVFKHYPLSSQCNPVMDQDMHPQACMAAQAAQAAGEQGKFWEFHDALFTEGVSSESIEALSQRLGLNQVQFTKDRQSARMVAKVQADIALANQLGVSGTPSVFLNKRKVENLSPELLEELILKVLAKSP